MCICPNCGFDVAQPALARVAVKRAAWGGGPALWLSGRVSDLLDLCAAGYAERNAAGWYVPTRAFPGVAEC